MLASPSISSEHFTADATVDSPMHVAVRAKRALSFNKASAVNKAAKLRKFAQSLEKLIDQYKQLVAKSAAKRQASKETLDATIDKLRRCMLIPKVNVLQECSHLQQLLYDNQDEMCRVSMVLLKEKLALTNAALDDLSANANLQVDAGFFKSPKDICQSNPKLPKLLQERSDLDARLKQAKLDYVRVSREVEKEEAIDRGTRILRVVEDFYQVYRQEAVRAAQKDAAGKQQDKQPQTPSPNKATAAAALNVVPSYHPAHTQEFEFSRFLLDERCKEGQVLCK